MSTESLENQAQPSAQEDETGVAANEQAQEQAAVRTPDENADAGEQDRVKEARLVAQAKLKLDPAAGSERLGLIMDVGLQLSVELGRTHLTVRELLELQKGSVVELERTAGDAVDVFVNDHLMARGEVVVVDDKFGVRINEIIAPNGGEGGK